MNIDEWERFTVHCGKDIKLAVYRFKGQINSTENLSSQSSVDCNVVRPVAVLVAGDFRFIFNLRVLQLRALTIKDMPLYTRDTIQCSLVSLLL